MKIVSGGQTGVDRAALDAAMTLGIEVGGWCPGGRMAEDGPIPEHYPLQVLHGAGYRKRTEQNVIDSDGTVIIYFTELSSGTELTHKYCLKHERPHLLVCGEIVVPGLAAQELEQFVANHDIQVLNVAGPRASGEPGGYQYTKEMMNAFLS